MRKRNRSCKFLEPREVVARTFTGTVRMKMMGQIAIAHEQKEKHIDLRLKRRFPFRVLILRGGWGHPIRDTKKPARQVSVEVRSRISEGSTSRGPAQGWSLTPASDISARDDRG